MIETNYRTSHNRDNYRDNDSSNYNRLLQLLTECVFSLHETGWLYRKRIYIILYRNVNYGKFLVIWDKNDFLSQFDLFDQKVSKMLDFSPFFTAN